LQQTQTEQIDEEFVRFLQLDSARKYRKKIKGYVMAFNTHEKKYKVTIRDSKKASQPSTQLNKETIQKIKMQRDQAYQLKLLEDRENVRKMHEKLRKEKQNKQKPTGMSDQQLMGDGYLSIKHKQLVQKKPEHTKLTFEQIEKMHFTDLQGNGDDDFRPSDIFDETDVLRIN